MVKTSANTAILRSNYDTISIILRSLRIIVLKAQKNHFIRKIKAQKIIQLSESKGVRNNNLKKQLLFI